MSPQCRRVSMPTRLDADAYPKENLFGRSPRPRCWRIREKDFAPREAPHSSFDIIREIASIEIESFAIAKRMGIRRYRIALYFLTEFFTAFRKIRLTGLATADPDDLDGQVANGGGVSVSRQPPATAEPERPTLPFAFFFLSHFPFPRISNYHR